MNFDDILEHSRSISTELNLAIRTAAAAGEIIQAGFAELTVDDASSIEQKEVGDLVSQVDRDADQAATSLLRSESQLPILSEELNCDLEERDNLWIVDPLDASTAYLMQAGRQYPSVLIAQRTDGETSVGVCFFPLTGEWYYAQRGRGAWKNGKRLVCDRTESLSETWVEMNQYGASKFETAYFRNLNQLLRSDQGARLVTSNAPHAGVAMRIADNNTPLAAAVHDNNPESVKQGPWDIAGPQVILEEAGGVFMNSDGTRTDPFSVEPFIVARSAKLAHAIRDVGAREHSTK